MVRGMFAAPEDQSRVVGDQSLPQDPVRHGSAEKGTGVLPESLSRLLDGGQIPGQVGRRFAESGHLLYLVGGTVRDAFMPDQTDREGDLDFATNARPEAVEAIIEGWADAIYTVGATYGTVGGIKAGRTFEITTFRKDVYHNNSRHPTVSYSDSIEEDLGRRDFTVNTLALKVPEGRMEDPCGGLDDLANGILRTPASPERAFGDDPLRMVRLFRFWASLGLRPDDRTLAAVTGMADRIEIVSAERIRDELSKLITSPRPAEALRGLVDSGLADRFLPELSALRMEQPPQYRHKDVFEHTLAVVEKASTRLVLRLACLMHGIGKPQTRDFNEAGATFRHHDMVGARLARRRLGALRYPRAVISDVCRLVELHLRPHAMRAGCTDPAIRRYVRDSGPLLQDLNELGRCDMTTRNRHRAQEIKAQMDQMEQRIADLREREDIKRLRPPVNGHQVMAHLGIPPGPALGEIMNILLNHRVENGPYLASEALDIARSWATKKGPSAL